MTTPITGIALEGYQVFDKYTFIPLERLTLLFGPNSAGKSAVHEAIELGQLLLNSSATKFDLSNFLGAGFDDKKISDLLARHWRRKSDSDGSFSPSLKIEIRHTTSCLADQVIADNLGREIPEQHHFNQPDDLQLESKWHFYDLDTEDGGFSFQWDYELTIETDFLLGYIGTDFKINLEHPLIRNIPNKLNIKRLLSHHSELVDFNDGILKFKSCILGFQPSAADFRKKNTNWLHYNPAYFFSGSIAPPIDKPVLRESISELSLLVGSIISATQGNTNINLKFVSASRYTPSPEQLTFELGDCHDTLIKSKATGIETYRSLAASIGSKLKSTSLSSQPSSELADSVNRALADHLFLDQGYQIDFDYRVLLSKTNSEAAINGYELDAEEFGYVVRLFVKDNHGRQHRIDDVGSGIGYLLPVLSAAFDGHWNSSPCFIQQPELHIHPALQASLGDVFIEASNQKQLIIETHSEHLVLRILKRIRQTHSSKSIANELKIKATDVCILYLDPSPSGFTSVRRLRVDQEGEFLDKWPRGFFTERDQELFDE